jgi:tetratricopeptide (TPR) repeat protein
MRRTIFVALVAAALPAAASAAATILGGSLGRDCYLAAEAARGRHYGLDVCDRALADEALSTSDRAATLVNRGILKMQSKELTGAIEDFDDAIRTRPGTAEAYINKGIALVHLGGRDRDAVELLTQGIAKNPARPEIAYYIRGVANEQLGATREAYEDYARAASLKPEWAEPAAQLSRFSVVRKATAGI